MTKNNKKILEFLCGVRKDRFLESLLDICPALKEGEGRVSVFEFPNKYYWWINNQHTEQSVAWLDCYGEWNAQHYNNQKRIWEVKKYK